MIPRSWSSKGAWARQPLPRVEAPSWQQWDQADILIERGEDSVFGENPFAIQYGGCGVQGRHLVIPDTFLRGYAASSDYAPDRHDKYGKPCKYYLNMMLIITPCLVYVWVIIPYLLSFFGSILAHHDL